MAGAAELRAVLEKTLSPFPEDQTYAKSILGSAYENSYGELVKLLSEVVRDSSLPPAVRQAGGLQLKNALVAKGETARTARATKWLAVPADVRAYVKTNVVESLGTEGARPSQAAQCVAGIAGVELERGEWAEVIPALVAKVTGPGSTETAKEASLEALGYVCQDLEPGVLQSQANAVLTAIVNGMKKEETSERVRLAATNALYNSLEFTHSNFANDGERNLIMQVICETTQSRDVAVSVAALQCLVKIMSLYYTYMEPYMGPALFSITVAAMKSSVEEVALQGIEFWSNVAEEEIELACEAEEAAAEGRPPESVSRFYAKGALKHLIPIITQSLKRQEEGDEDEWNPSKAAGVSLMLLSQCVGDDVVHEVLPFITDNISSADWRARDAAIMAFGSILEGPDPEKLQLLVTQALPRLIEAIRDPHTVVRDTAAWCLSKVCETCKGVVVRPETLTPLLPALSAGVSQEPRVAANACWAVASLAEAAFDAAREHGQVDGEGNPTTYILSPVFDSIVSELLKTTDRPDASMNNLRIAAYEALMSLIKNSPKDCYQTVQKTTMLVLKKMEQLLAMESSSLSSSERSQLRDLQSLLCGTLQSVLQKMDKGDAESISGVVMTALTRMMAEGSKAATSNGSTLNGESEEHVSQGGVMEDALMAVSTLVELLGPGFARYLPGLKPYLLAGLANHADGLVCAAAVGTVVDLCRALEGGIGEHMDQIMELYMGILQDEGTVKEVKPSVLSAFGDAALAVGTAFTRYAPHCLQLLSTAAQCPMPADRSNYDDTEYVDSLREAVLEGYTGIVQGLRSGNPPEREHLLPLQPEVPTMVALVETVGAEKESSEPLLGAAAGLVGDLASAFGADVLPALETAPVAFLLTRCKKAKSSKPKSLANYATKQLKGLKAQGTFP